MLEELADDRADPDPFRATLDAGAERADATGDHVDVDARGARPIEGLDDLRVDQRVDLDHDARASARLRVADLALDQVRQPGPQREWRDEQPPEGLLARVAGQHVEQVGGIGAQLGPA